MSAGFEPRAIAVDIAAIFASKVADGRLEFQELARLRDEIAAALQEVRDEAIDDCALVAARLKEINDRKHDEAIHGDAGPVAVAERAAAVRTAGLIEETIRARKHS